MSLGLHVVREADLPGEGSLNSRLDELMNAFNDDDFPRICELLNCGEAAPELGPAPLSRFLQAVQPAVLWVLGIADVNELDWEDWMDEVPNLVSLADLICDVLREYSDIYGYDVPKVQLLTARSVADEQLPWVLGLMELDLASPHQVWLDPAPDVIPTDVLRVHLLNLGIRARVPPST
jgi:hypothetical protein